MYKLKYRDISGVMQRSDVKLEYLAMAIKILFSAGVSHMTVTEV